ncbi:type II toxin-antitoxin system VapC family toxin [Deinococcus sp. AJ005]|uniref:type II toxin-antitoxin system VapC family toxin n=1 Tax=Deinococcus sp. AJ005 TaxID=2652443 RepID=UPI00125CA9A2|nr:type II toxin-antitoxin system VapC family toxin [Deinococcus sp. AJ005]QFP76193.1 type II toxin-antitoxin system VapC family toxin [Deinococcus sp. AJ005]
MSTALDTNILLALWNSEPAAPQLGAALDHLKTQGRVLICGAVYAELCGLRPDLDAVLETFGIRVDPEMSLMAWNRAGVAHSAHSKRRQASGGGLPRRILTDFLVGAHASIGGHSLLTLNTADFGDFPEVPLLTVL